MRIFFVMLANNIYTANVVSLRELFAPVVSEIALFSNFVHTQR